MRAYRFITAIVLGIFAVAAQAQGASAATAKDKPATAPHSAPAAKVERASARPQEGPFSVFTYESIGATPTIRMSQPKASAPPTETVVAKRQ